VVVYDPRAGEIRGHRQLRKFVSGNQSWLADLHARIETMASTSADGRAVVELLAHLPRDGGEVAWPVAVVAESPDDLRPAILPPGGTLPGDVVGRFQAALASGDADALVRAFEPDGYYREPIGPHLTHRGPAELRSFFTERLGARGGIALQPCEVTDDGVRCAVEYNFVRWGGQDLPPQAGLGVYERGPDGLLAAARAYDDVEPPWDGRP
jgi:limonene-1,2-epoxide hydrolase